MSARMGPWCVAKAQIRKSRETSQPLGGLPRMLRILPSRERVEEEMLEVAWRDGVSLGGGALAGRRAPGRGTTLPGSARAVELVGG
jgi:hypothetical protein